MTMRNENAYETPAAVFIGLGLHKLFESLFLIVSKRSAAGHTAIYKVGVLSFILLTGCLGCQFTLLDYLTSPYVSPQYWLRDLQIANYGLNFVTSIVMAILFILCIRVFYKDNIKFMISMYAFFSLLVVFKGTGGLAGVIVGYDVASLKYDYLNHPLHHIIPFLLGFGQLFEAIFVTIGSIGYIYAKISDQDDSKPLIDHIIKADGIKFLLLVLVDWIISGFEIHSWLTGSYTYVTHVGLYMGSYSFGLQLYIFLKNSHIPPKQIFKRKQSSRTNDSKRDSLATDLKAFKRSTKSTNGTRDSLNTYKVPLINRADDQLIVVFPPQQSHSSLFVSDDQDDTEVELEFWDVDDYYNHYTSLHRLSRLSEPFTYQKYN